MESDTVALLRTQNKATFFSLKKWKISSSSLGRLIVLLFYYTIDYFKYVQLIITIVYDIIIRARCEMRDCDACCTNTS